MITCTLGDILTLQRGHDLPKIKMIDGPYPVMGSNGIIGWHTEYTEDFPCPSITIGRSGNVGTPHLCEKKAWAHNTALYVKDFKGNDPYYLFYLLQTLDLKKVAGGSAVPTLNRNHVYSLKVSISKNVRTQRQIGEFLRCFDRKIQLNNQINDYLEQLCLLKVQALLNASDEVICLEKIANVNPSYSLKKGQIAKFIDMAALGINTSMPNEIKQKAFSGGQRFSNGDTLIARITPCLENGKGGFVNYLEQNEIAFGSTEYIVLNSASPVVSNEVLYFITRTKDFREYAVKQMTGTSGRQRLSWQSVSKYEFVDITRSSKLAEVNNLCHVSLNVIRNNFLQNQRLAVIRDILLPKLLSGALELD